MAADAAFCLESNSLWKGFEGFGSQKLHTLAAYALRKNLMAWLELYDVRLTEAEEERTKRQLREKVIADQRRKEALKLHSQTSADASLLALEARVVSRQDAGHTFSLATGLSPAGGSGQQDLSLIEENSDELLNTMDWARKHDEEQQQRQQQRRQAAVSPAPEPASGAATPSPFECPPEPTEAVALSSPRQSGGQPPLSAALRSNSRKSKRRLVPSRPAPPPPISRAPSASERALALIVMPPSQSQHTPPLPARGHHRRGSWEKGASRRNSHEGGLEARERMPFASPFAQVSSSPIDDLQDAGVAEEAPMRIQMSSHPSGVDLVDPPEGPSLSFVEQPSLTRRGSKTLINALPSFSRSKKSMQLKSEPSGRFQDFQRAVSILGFDNNLDEDEDCGICLDEAVNVGINGCCHKLCCECALKLCQTNKKPPLCPFCRTFIEGFHPATDLIVKM